VLELVIRQRLGLGVITFSDRLEEGIAACIVCEGLLENSPADWRTVRERRELMANGGGVRSKPAKRSFFSTAVRMAQRQPVTRRTRVDALLLDALRKPVSACEKHDRARGESVRGGEWADVLLTGAVARDDFVRKRQLAPRD
jgi:hypothetical protein